MNDSKNISCTDDTASQWSRIASRYTKILESRHVQVFPVVRDLIRTLQAKIVLDFGCGEGLFLHETIGQGVLREAINYDISEEMSRLAALHAKEFPNLHVVGNLAEVEAESVDLVTSIAVWMCQRTSEDCDLMLNQINAVTRPDGYFIAAVTHPCFRWFEFSTFRTDFEPRDYLRSGMPFEVSLYDQFNELSFSDTHWNLGDMSGQLNRAGFMIERLFEIADSPSNGTCPWLIILARKSTPHSRSLLLGSLGD